MPPGSAIEFEPRRNIDAIAEDIVSFHDHITEIDADTVKKGAGSWHVTVAPRHALLKINGAAQCFGDALEFHQHPVTRGLDDAALAFDDGWIDQL